MKNRGNNTTYQPVKFQRKDNPINLYDGIMINEDFESCTISINIEGTDATIVCYYDEWEIMKVFN
jgi:hypothetical protein